jgi:very-short-patch-repair endonuclease
MTDPLPPRRRAPERPIPRPQREGRGSPAELWAREEAAARRRQWEDKLAQHIAAFGLPIPEREFVFHQTRKWRFDFAFVAFHVAVEVDGGQWTGGRHVRGRGVENDAEKMAAAAELGWNVLRFTPMQIRTGRAVRVLENVLIGQRP